MRTILVIGAGRSSSTMIKYFLDNAQQESWQIRVGDMDFDVAKDKIGDHSHGEAFKFDALNSEERAREVKNSDIIISMLPARFHTEVIKDCIRFKKDVITPSYINEQMKSMNDEVISAGILSMNEMGLDPGIDHMSAKKILDEIESIGGKIKGF